MPLEVRVHRGRCIGSKTCTHAAPGVFRVDHENIAVVVDPTAASEEEILLAAEGCPTGAITVSRDASPG
jgi:ferredoxin